MVPGPRDSIFFDRGWDCGWEYSEVESRKSDQNPHLEGGRVEVESRKSDQNPHLEGGRAHGGSIRWEYILFF